MKAKLSSLLCIAGAGLMMPANAVTVDLGSQSGNTITDEVLAFGWIRSDDAGRRAGGETGFIGGTNGSNDFRAYVAYDLSGFSVGDVINSATVSLFSEGATTFNANGGIVGDATSIGLNITQIAEITGYGDGAGNNAATDVGATVANWTGINGLYGATITTVTLNLDTLAINQQVDFDVTGAIQAAVDAGSSKLTFGVTSPDAIATNARNFFAFEGVDQGGDGSTSGNIGPNLNVDFTPVPEPSAALLAVLGGMMALRRRR